jgi:hypothetical protein
MRRLVAIGLTMIGLLVIPGIASADPPNHANNHAQNSQSDNQGPCDALKDNGVEDHAAAWDVHGC